MKLCFVINNKIISETDGCYLKLNKVGNNYLFSFIYDIENIINHKIMTSNFQIDLQLNVFELHDVSFKLYSKIEYKSHLNSNQRTIKIALNNLIKKLEAKYNNELQYLIIE